MAIEDQRRHRDPEWLFKAIWGLTNRASQVEVTRDILEVKAPKLTATSRINV